MAIFYENLKKAYEASTQNNFEYLCEYSFKNERGSWVFGGYAFPDDGIIKAIKGNTYLYCSSSKRYLLNSSCKKILGL